MAGIVAVLALVLPGLMPAQADVLDVVETERCPWEDDSGGMWGKDGKCTFTCKAPAGAMTGDVDADDRTASVSVTATCGVHDGHCSDDDYCKIDPPVHYEGGGEGLCTGSSDEVFDQGLYFNCWTNLEDNGGGDECLVDDPICVEVPDLPILVLPPVDLPPLPPVPSVNVPEVAIKMPPTKVDLKLVRMVSELCDRVLCKSAMSAEEAGLFAPRSGALVQVSSEGTFGFVCPGDMQECTLVHPSEAFIDGRMVYSV